MRSLAPGSRELVSGPIWNPVQDLATLLHHFPLRAIIPGPDPEWVGFSRWAQGLLGCLGDLGSRLSNMGLAMASYGGLQGILSGLAKSTDHPSNNPFWEP